jgi:hypothetical protein
VDFVGCVRLDDLVIMKRFSTSDAPADVNYCQNQDIQDLRIYRIKLSEMGENTIEASSKCYPIPPLTHG